MTQTTLVMHSYDSEPLVLTDMFVEVEPKDAIRDALPDSCSNCPEMATRLGEMAFWLSDGRISAQRAAAVLIENSNCQNC